MNATIEIVEPGVATTLQDRGRPGYAHLGVSPSGAVDPWLAALVNRLVGNPAGATVLETCGGLVLRATGHVLVATSADPGPRTLGPGESCHVPAGRSGRLWHYVAVRGGLLAEPVLGSTSSDTLAHLGPPPCQAGDRLAVGGAPVAPIVADIAPLADVPGVVRITAGPRVDWLADGLRALVSGPWRVTTTSRVGVRLSGVPLVRARSDELASEGLVRGAIQAPPDGDAVMMLCDHPTTGGYPVVAVVHPDDVASLAQHAPGSEVRFRVDVA